MRADRQVKIDGPEAEIAVLDQALVLDPSGILYWPAERMLVVADLHLEKGSSHAERRIFLPPYDTAATLASLSAVVMRYRPATILCLGDSFHDRRADGRMAGCDRETLAALQAGRDWIWVSGNHDPDPPAGLGGTACDELALGSLVFRHEPTPSASPGEIAGHLHPCGRLRHRGRSVRRRCFAGDNTRLVMPAFGAFTGGLNVLDDAWSGIFTGRRFEAHMLGEQRVYSFPGGLCCAADPSADRQSERPADQSLRKITPASQPVVRAMAMVAIP